MMLHTHTLDLTLGNRTPDDEIRKLAIQEDRIVVTKDSDFVTLFLLRGAPPKLLLISTGNIANDSLSQLMNANITAVITALMENNFVELGVSTITIHA